MSTAVSDTIDYTQQSELEIMLEDLMPYEDSDDPNRRTHIVNAEMNQSIALGRDMRAKEIVDTARFLGLEIVSLCGYRWVPKHNPEKFDACNVCMKIAGMLMRGAGE